MVNGGGTVVLEFSRSGLKTKLASTMALWNQFVNIDSVVMYLADDESRSVSLNADNCLLNSFHNSSELKPIVETSWKEIRTYYYDNSMILPDSGVVRNELNIIDSNLKLVYTSNQAAGFSSTIFLLLTRNQVPDTLRQIHVHISVEGVLHKQTLDAYPSLSYEFAWDRRNAYEQRVYGVTFAKVKVGYEYEDCDSIYWDVSVVKLAGYDLGSSEIGNWNIDVHHRLNTQQGILHKGDGTTIYLNEIQKQIEIVAGVAKQKRSQDCEAAECDRHLFEPEPIKFFSPTSVSVNKDGILFVADYNFVWMLNNSQPQRVLELK